VCRVCDWNSAYYERCAGCATGIEFSKTIIKVKYYLNIENNPLKDTDKNFEKNLCFKISLSMW
jgi:hypothetical protein